MPANGQTVQDAESDPTVVRSSLPFPVVGIGASAGGISTLQRFFEQMPATSGMAFVVVLHLSPSHESSLDTILQRVTKMPVRQVTSPSLIEANHIYVIPPSKELSMTDGHLRVSELKRPEGRHTAIDLFFRSLAQVHRERAICLVLSGTGSDGTQGLKRIKELGGVTLAQSVEDAEYDGMPRSAVATGLVDFVLPVAEMPQKLLDLWHNAARLQLPSPPDDMRVLDAPTQTAAAAAEEALASIKGLLRARTGHDFLHYKRATVLRRLERRMQVAAVPTLPDYADYLEKNPAETKSLLQDMLISVTNFFRDRDAFEALERQLMARLTVAEPDVGMRAWTVGCATGEEAYSVAIVLSELLRSDTRDCQLQVFASDIDQKAVEVGRAGVYPESIVTDVAPSRLREYFTHEADQYRIVKAVRDKILFSAHNVLRDPPFTRLDLLCCRNLLIYLDREAQLQLLETFHFALKPGGILFLGSAETAEAAEDLFTPIDKKHRLYVAKLKSRPSRLPPLLPTFFPAMATAPTTRDAKPSIEPMELLHRRAIDAHAPATVLIDADYEVIHTVDRASRFLRLPGGAPTKNILKLVRPELRVELRTALFQASSEARSIEARRVEVAINGLPTLITMNVHPVPAEAAGRCYLVVFNESGASLASDPAKRIDQPDPIVAALELEVIRLNERLQGTIGESATSTEELRASNEELQTINEELRSATEELETSKEELQSVNEELITVNSELSNKVDETAKINDDLQNLITSTDIGTIFVDRSVRIKRYTPAVRQLFNIIASDVGRPLLDLTHRLNYPELFDDVASTLKSLVPVEREVASTDDRWFLVRSIPYRTTEDRIQGAVLNFIDITERRRAEAQAQATEQRMRMVADSMSDYAIITFDVAGVTTSWSRGAEKMFGYSPAEAVGRQSDFIFTPLDVLDGVPEAELRMAREQGRASDDRWHLRKDGTTFYCSGIVTPLMENGTLYGFAKIARDLTERREAETRQSLLEAEQAVRLQLEQASQLKDEFLAVMSHELKNPLNLIQVSAELLLRSPQAKDLAIVQRTGATIKRTVASQAQIIDDLLDLSRLNTGKLVMRPANVAMADLIDDLTPVLQAEAQRKNQTLTVSVDAGLQVYADPTRIEQVIWNLVSNAVKFTDDGGTIDLSVTASAGSCRIVVTDTGIGIDGSMLDQVFDMFHQAHRGIGRAKGGLGIGLALVKRLAEMQGGSIEVASDGIGQGARFTVTLPLHDGASAAVKPEIRAIDNFEGLRVLWVDDDVATLEAVGTLLEYEKAQVTLASNAQSALEAARESTFDLILSDIAMPGRDGYDLIEELKSQRGTRGAIAIAVTGFGREQDRKRAIAAGFDAHLGKPVELETLLAAINHVRAGRT